MKFLIVSLNGASTGLAHRIQEEGNEVFIYFDQPHFRNCLKGIVPQVASLSEGLAKDPDVVFWDMVGKGEAAIRVRKLGYKIVGSGAEYQGKSFQDEIELDRAFGMQIMKAGGITIPPTTEFKGAQIDQAKKFVKESGLRYVLKPDDNKNAETTYVSEGPEDMIAHLEYCKQKKLLSSGDAFILQEFRGGVEISTEVWFSNGKPVLPANGTMETKKFMDNDMGPNTGCSSSTVWFYDRKEPKIVQLTLKRLYPLIERLKYTGPLDINCIVSDKDHKPNGLEWTARPGYSAIYAYLRLLKKDWAENLYLMANGQLEEWDYRPGFGYAVRATMPPYPLAGVKDEKLRERIYKATAGARCEYDGDPESFFPTEVMADPDNPDQVVTAGVDGEIAELTGYGKTIEEAKREAHKNLKKLHFPDKQARLDGWERPYKDLPTLKSWGYEVPEVEEKKPQGEKAHVH